MDELMRLLPIVTISKNSVGTEHNAQARTDPQRENKGEKERTRRNLLPHRTIYSGAEVPDSLKYLGSNHDSLVSPVSSVQSVQFLSRVQLFASPWTAAHQASLSITNSRNLPKIMSIELVMLSNHLIFCCPLPLLPSNFPSIRVFFQ